MPENRPVPRVTYLFTSFRQAVLDQVSRGQNHGDGFWGMVRLPRYGIDAKHVEVEQVYPLWICALLRKYMSVHTVHVPVFWKWLATDIVFTSTAFGTQLIRTFLPFRRPLWVMHDFSITGMLGTRKTLRQKLFSYMVSKAAGIVTISVQEQEKLKHLFPDLADRIVYIPFGVDLRFFSPDPSVREERQIIAVGFDRDRDWKTLIAACSGLDVQVVLATRPSRVTSLQPLPKNVHVHEFSVTDLVAAYRKSQIVIVPLDTSAGINDAMGCSTLLEAMAMQKAVIATRTPTMESYITHGENGLLVQEKDVAAMRLAILDLLQDTKKRIALAAAARAYAVQHLDAEVLASRLADYFKGLLSL